jgi:hypothetical protein
MTAASFTAVAGMTHLVGGYGTADWWVFLDGVLEQSEIDTPGGVGFSVDVPLASTSRYLTLVSTDHGDDFSLDQVMFGDPIVHLQAVPEPGCIALLLAGAMALGIWRLRRNA